MIINRLIKLIISILFFIIELLIYMLLKITGKEIKGKCVIIFYHSVKDNQRDRFARQMDKVIKYTRTIPISYKSQLINNKKYSSVTFDDGFESIIKNAIPELKKRNIYSTIFVKTGNLGKKQNWINDKKSTLYNEKQMNASNIKKVCSKLLKIGSHCVTHRNLMLLDRKEIQNELCNSKKYLENKLSEKIEYISFPYGGNNREILKLSKEAGYKRVFTILPKLAFKNEEEYETGRIHVEPSDWNIEFILKLIGSYRWLPIAFKIKRKLKKIFLK